MVKEIERFAKSASLWGGKKICLIDEADHMTKDVQASLRYLIEEVSGNTRFLLTANDSERLTPAMRSRCLPICFDVRPQEVRAVIDRMIRRYERTLADLGYFFDQGRIREIVSIYFPDLRSIANRFQMELD
jgi:DNA polymerase III delta prime subunit